MADLKDIQEQLGRLDRDLREKHARGDPAELERLIDDELQAFDGCGKAYDKSTIADYLAREATAARGLTSDSFHVRLLGTDFALLTYRSTGICGDSGSEWRYRHSSIWKRCEAQWRLIFRQGGPIGSDHEKVCLEIERLGIDVTRQRLSWYRRPPYLSLLVPISIASLAYLAAVSSGWFEDERRLLRAENTQMRSQGDDLRSEIESLKSERDSLKESNSLQKFALRFDRSQISAEIEAALPTERSTATLTRDQLEQMAKRFGLMGAVESGQFQWQDGDISYWYEEALPAWDVTVHFLAHRVILEKANELDIVITNSGEWTSWTKPVQAELTKFTRQHWASSNAGDG